MEAQMQIEVDRDLCEANAVCCGLAPAVFSLDDDEVLVIRQPDADVDVDRVAKAVDRCPKNALKIVG
jgi:ferredoxin